MPAKDSVAVTKRVISPRVKEIVGCRSIRIRREWDCGYVMNFVVKIGGAFLQTRFWGVSPRIGEERVEVAEGPGLSKEGSR